MILRRIVEAINLHLAKPCSLGNCLASLEERAVGVGEAVVARANRISWTGFGEVQVHIFADVINWRGVSWRRLKKATFLGDGWEGWQVRWRTVEWQMILPEVELLKVRLLVVHIIINVVFIVAEVNEVDVAWHSPARIATHKVAHDNDYVDKKGVEVDEEVS